MSGVLHDHEVAPAGRLRRSWPADRGGRAVLVALGCLLAAGIGLRLSLVLTRGPAFTGNGDVLLYIQAARGELFGPPTAPVGYQLFLRGAHALSANLSFAIALQHALGVATALLLFALVRRVAPAAWGLAPAGVLLLAGPQVLLEHSPMSETLFTFLVAAACYCTVRALDEPRPRWAFAAGLVGVMAGCVRPVGLVLPLLAVVWLVAATPGSTRRRLVAGAAAAFAAWILLAGYISVARHEVGYVGPGLSRAGGWNLYARVAPFADCGRFTPPPRARGLCEHRPAAKRPTALTYALGGSAAAARTFGGWSAIRPADDRALTAFARGAIVHQPGDYLRAVGTDLARFWSSGSSYRPWASYDEFSHNLTHAVPLAAAQIGRWYDTSERPPLHDAAPGALRTYERHTRLEGPSFVLLVVLALAGTPLARGRRLAVALLMIMVSAAMLVIPVATLFFYPRYAVPAYGPLAVAGAIGAAGLWERAAAWLARRRGAVELGERVAA